VGLADLADLAERGLLPADLSASATRAQEATERSAEIARIERAGRIAVAASTGTPHNADGRFVPPVAVAQPLAEQIEQNDPRRANAIREGMRAEFNRRRVESIERDARRVVAGPSGRARLVPVRHRRGCGGRARPRQRSRRTTTASRGSPSDDGGSGDPEPSGSALPHTGRQQTAGGALQ
jgi:hypothetical protein